MEGKGLLFKIFADIDVFDIEIDANDPEEFINTVKAIAPTFGGINLEDIKAPEAFEIERRLKDELDIPVMHDDQHGTAVVTLAALWNACRITERKIEDLSVVIAGILRENLSVINTKINIRPHIASEASAFYIDNDMCDYDKLNDLPRIIKTFGCLYPNYTLQGNDA